MQRASQKRPNLRRSKMAKNFHSFASLMGPSAPQLCYPSLGNGRTVFFMNPSILSLLFSRGITACCSPDFNIGSFSQMFDKLLKFCRSGNLANIVAAAWGFLRKGRMRKSWSSGLAYSTLIVFPLFLSVCSFWNTSFYSNIKQSLFLLLCVKFTISSNWI